MKKTLAVLLAMGMTAMSLAGCGSSAQETTAATTAATEASAEQEYAGSSEEADTSAEAESADSAASGMTGSITVVSREDGSGTRGAFVELFGIDADGEDNTTEDAEITNSTAVMMTTIAGNAQAIGYISLGSLNDTVKAVSIDGAEATVENIQSGTYKVSRPFNIATGAEVSEVAQDFINFIMSDEGQAVVADNGYISQESTGAYTPSGLSGKVVAAGSSSVAPVMEKIKEAYETLNPDVTVEVQQSDSTTGMTSAIEGVCDIGMASRELKDSELSAGLTPTVIATDGIAVIVNQENPVSELTSENVKGIFTGEVTEWEALN